MSKCHELRTNSERSLDEPAYCFGGFTLDSARAALLRNGEEIPLRQRTFDVLTHLVRNSGRLVSNQELFEALWRDVAVTDDSLVQCLSKSAEDSRTL